VKFARLALIALLFAPSACGLANQDHETSWTATFSHKPDVACAAAVIATLPEVSESTRLDLVDRQIIDVYVNGSNYAARDQNGHRFPNLYVIFLHGRTEQFRLSFLGRPRPADAREVAARAIVAQLTDACTMPELAKAREEDEVTWLPYLFNM
jgi:hypothetical protein